jgi:putative DNA primase/helicase
LGTGNNGDFRQWYADLSSAALSRAPAILSDWLPGGQVVRREYHVGSLRGGPGNSLKVNLETGRWKDFASGEPGGSNLVALYAAINRLEWKEATDELGKQFGIDRPSAARALHSVANWTPITPIPEDAPFDDDGNPPYPPLGNSETTEIKGSWCYLSAEGQPIMWRVRVERADGAKDVMPLTFCQSGDGTRQWRWKDIGSPRLLYGLEWLATSPDAPVLIVEGEKTADAARALLPDWIVLTWPGGTNRISTKYTDWSPVLNRTAKTRTVLWPDADEAGTRAMAILADILRNRCEIVRPDPSWKKGWDLADGAADGWTTAQTIEYLEAHLIKPTIPDEDSRPMALIAGGDLKIKCGAVWEAIRSINSPPWIVGTATGVTIVDRDVFGRARRQSANIDVLRFALTERIRFQRFNPEGGVVAAHPPDVLLINLLTNPRPPLPFMRRMSEVPIVAPDGRVVGKEGFDSDSGIYYLPHPSLAEVDVTPAVSAAEVEGAVALIDDMLADFPFLEDCDRAHAIAFALVPLLRMTIIGRTPMFRFEAPQPRTGKSLLMRVLARLCCSVISDVSPTKEEEEWRKRITGVLRKEPEAFLIDNADSLESAQLKKLLTDDVWEDRELGSTNTVRYPVQCAFAVSLNNPIISREIMGRSLRVRLDAKSQRPELRTGFRHPNLEEYVGENRAALVGALLTIARASNAPALDAPILGGYEAFCRRMGAVLKAARIDGFLSDRKDDSSLSQEENGLIQFVQLWADEYGTHHKETADLVSVAEKVEGIYLGKGDSQRAKVTALGIFLRQHRGSTVGNYQIGDPSNRRPTTWHLIPLRGATPSTPQELEEQTRETDFDDRF